MTDTKDEVVAEVVEELSEPTTIGQTAARKATSVPIEQVRSCTPSPLNRAARCADTAAGLACCSDSSVNNHRPPVSASFAVARRRSLTVSTTAADRSPTVRRSLVRSASSEASVSGSPPAAARASRPSGLAKNRTSSRVKG